MNPNRETSTRIPIGLWTELAPGSRWANEGVSRVVGFLVEGASETQRYLFKLAVPYGMGQIVRDDLRSTGAKEFEDWTVDEGPEFDPGHDGQMDAVAQHKTAMARLAEFANTHLCVQGWVITFPFFEASKLLKAKRAVLFPDAIPYDFPWGWPNDWAHNGAWPRWFAATQRVLSDADAVITFSQHVSRRHVQGLFGFAAENIRVIPLAPPDLSPYRNQFDGLDNREKLRSAAKLLRDFAADRGLRYLADFPFEDVDYCVISTQDRPTKNIAFATKCLVDLIRKQNRNLKLILTADIHYGADWTDLPGVIETRQCHRDILSMRDLPRDVHAALYFCAQATIHPSFFEGIVGALPFYESLSLGTPAIIARGPHTSELLMDFPEVEPFTFDPHDAAAFSRLLTSVLDNRESALAKLRPVYEMSRKRTWGHVADAYAEAAMNLPHAPQTPDVATTGSVSL